MLKIKNIKSIYLKILERLGIDDNTMYYIAGPDKLPAPLKNDEEMELLKRLMNKDSEAKNILIERNLRLVAHISKKYASTNIDQEDLISIGTIGLIKGINSYKINKGTKLSTYVSRCIDNEILMYLRATKKHRSGSVPRRYNRKR